MSVKDVPLFEESKTRYLTYALSVVHSRALPDVRDGLKPVQRRILYAMLNNLHLSPDKDHRKSAAVVGEVLARYHPHGDVACYEAMVRMAQDFSFRYPLVDGQGNFGSLDGDSAAAYRYTEAKLAALALEVIGDIGEETVAMRPNFDTTTEEPVVLPSRVPHLLMNGASGIAVGMATAIPPHNLKDLVQTIQLLIDDPEVPDAKLIKAIKGPDFPTGCLVMNTPNELRDIYTTGRGPVRMRATHQFEEATRGKKSIIITSIPYAVEKSSIVERIADLIIARKIPQLVDVRDESTDVVRVVLELAPGANADHALAYLFKHTPLQMNFNVNFTALVPSENPMVGRPMLLSLRQALREFVDFRRDVTRRKLTFERKNLLDRVHLLEGLMSVVDRLKEVIEIVRKSDGRKDSAEKLMKRFELSEAQAYFIVDLRVYQLSKTNVDEIETELTAKRKRILEIERILKSEKALLGLISADLTRLGEEFGDERRSKIVSQFEEMELNAEEFIEDEQAYVLITRDGWMKRSRLTSDPTNSRLREGDSFLFVKEASTRDSLAIFTNFGNLFVTKVHALSPTTGFGEPVQKMFRFQDGEAIVATMLTASTQKGDPETEVLCYTECGLGFRTSLDLRTETKKVGRRLAKVSSDDRVAGVLPVDQVHVLLLTREGYAVCLETKDIPILSGAGKGVVLQKMSKGDRVAAAALVNDKTSLMMKLAKGGDKSFKASTIEPGSRARRGEKIVARGGPVTALLVMNGAHKLQ